MANAEGETRLELACFPQGSTFEGKGVSIGFETDDIERDFNAAQANGMNPSEMQSPNPKTKFFFVYDPDGMTVQFIQEL